MRVDKNRSLNKAQQEAVEYTGGPLLIVAGAGTGKTTVLTEKIKYLIETQKARPEQILALAFNDKAAAEIQERLDVVLDLGYAEMGIFTFHAFCQRLLEEQGLDIGIPGAFKVLNQSELWLLMREHLHDFDLRYYRPLGNPYKHIHELIRHFSKCKDELISPEEYLNYAEQQRLDKDSIQREEQDRLTELANAYHYYNQLLLDKGFFDFGDLLSYSVRLLSEREKIRFFIQKRYQYILVDEFQDVNYAQYELIKLLSAKAELSVVGDDDQSIYAFRGASVSNILRFKDDFPLAKEIVLTENYRSTQPILDRAYELIQHNNPDRLEVKLNINKALKACDSLKSAALPEHLHFESSEDEAFGVVQALLQLKDTYKADWSDFAILVRANNHAEPFMAACESAGLPYEFLSSRGLYRQGIVLDSLSFFALLDSYHESSAVFRLLRLSFFEFKESDLHTLCALAKKKSISYYEALKRSQEFQLSQEGIRVCDALLELIHEGAKLNRSEKPTQVLYYFLEKSGYMKYLAQKEEEGDKEALASIHIIKQFFEVLESYQRAVPGLHISEALAYFRSMAEAGDEGALSSQSDSPDSLSIMTVHAAKGLEFRFVFLVNMVEERFPTRRRGESIPIPDELVKELLPQGDSHYQEERRLSYVGMTRAKELLFFTSADNYGGLRKKKISRFIGEAGLDQGSAEASSGEKKQHFGPTFTSQRPRKTEKTNNTEGFLYELPKAFSFSQIQTYETCPYKYKLAHILKLPSKSSASFSFGSTLHATLQTFYEALRQLNAVEQTSLFADPSKNFVHSQSLKVPSLEELLVVYEKAWIEDWYKSGRQREEYKKKGREILKVFYESQTDRWTIPVCLESAFNIKIGDYTIRGRIDRIDSLPDGTLEIIDYKSGKTKERLEASDKEQLLLYQIAAVSLPAYKNRGQVSKLTYWYLDENVRLEFMGTEDQLETLKDKLKISIGHIHGRDFSARPSKFVCSNCDFKEICEYREL